MPVTPTIRPTFGLVLAKVLGERAAIETAQVHCRPGAAALVRPRPLARELQGLVATVEQHEPHGCRVPPCDERLRAVLGIGPNGNPSRTDGGAGRAKRGEPAGDDVEPLSNENVATLAPVLIDQRRTTERASNRRLGSGSAGQNVRLPQVSLPAAMASAASIAYLTEVGMRRRTRTRLALDVRSATRRRI